MDYGFRLADANDEPAIRSFMRSHWGGPHPLIELPDFFKYYYAGGGGRLNFGLCEAGGQIAALAGFIPACRAAAPDIWISLWAADKAHSGSGLELMERMPALTGCRAMACNNIRPETRPFYSFLGYESGRIGHFYRLADMPPHAYRLARVSKKEIPPVSGGAQIRLLPSEASLEQSGFKPPQDANPRKDLWYIKRRFWRFPHQKYSVYAAYPQNSAEPKMLLCTRLISACGARVLRIADIIGPQSLLPLLGKSIERLMRRERAEYADCYCAGIPPDIMRAAGFAERLEGDCDNIIPNYLDPPLQKNTDYWYFTTDTENFTVFKADGDQDRPNIPLPAAP